MLQTDIKRESLGVVDFTEPVCSLADEAKELLGYGSLKDQIEHGSSAGPLAKAMADLGIEILNKSDVDLYQQEHLKETAKRLFAAWLEQKEDVRGWSGRFNCPTWEMTPIADYREPVPEFVLNKAIQIKKACPDALIYIEHLNESPDPFLVVKTQGDKNYSYSGKIETYKADLETYYVEVWNEPKFEGRVR